MTVSGTLLTKIRYPLYIRERQHVADPTNRISVKGYEQ